MKNAFNLPWRLMAATLYGPPRDGKIMGTLNVDVTAIDKYIKDQRRQGNKLTLTTFVAVAIGRALAKYPEINCHIRRGRLVPREYIDVMVTVGIKGGAEMAAVRIRDAHEKTASQIAGEIRTMAFESRQGQESKVMQNKYTLTKIPWPIRGWIYKLIRWLVHDLGINLGFMGYLDSAFGSIVLSNIGTIGLTTGFPALLPAAKIPAVINMGKCELKPVVRSKEVVVRLMLPLSATFDHRIVDGLHAGKMASTVARLLAKPEELDQSPR
ncbi:MAG: 2-oxo acid dehydrogenase subunit E2 [Candidatus Marinimicrobia bacterium]|nr:2-oxo acid dehydrogenase subunit E2 [Candidatus Neomarinimicrobiota bacterium]